jgi:hypothetical protein
VDEGKANEVDAVIRVDGGGDDDDVHARYTHTNHLSLSLSCCAELSRDGGNGSGNGDTNEARFVGPYCSPDDSTSIHLGVFAADGCAAGHLNASAAEALLLRDYPEFGVPVLYLTTAMVENKCLSCVEEEEEEEGSDTENEPVQQEQEGAKYRVSDVCLAPYVGAAKCEADMDSYYKDTEGCDYIRNVLPRLAASAATSGGSAAPSNSSSSTPSSTTGAGRRSGGGAAGGRGQMMMMTMATTTASATTTAKDTPSSSRRGRQSARQT